MDIDGRGGGGGGGAHFDTAAGGGNRVHVVASDREVEMSRAGMMDIDGVVVGATGGDVSFYRHIRVNGACGGIDIHGIAGSDIVTKAGRSG